MGKGFADLVKAITNGHRILLGDSILTPTDVLT